MASHQEDPSLPASARPVRRLVSILVRIMAAIVGLGIIGLVTFFIVFVTHYGDRPPPPGVVIVNRTPKDLNIYVYLPGQEPVLSADVPAHSRVESGITCGRLKMVAKDSAGRVVARRGPFPTCYETDWVISAVEDPSSGAG